MTTSSGSNIINADSLSRVFFAIGSSDPVRATWVGGELTGRLSASRSGGILIRTDEPVADVVSGTPICVESLRGDAVPSYHFYAEVTGITPEGVETRLPFAFQSADRRASRRFEFPVGHEPVVELFTALGVRNHRITNVSTGGLCFRDDGSTLLDLRATVPARIHLSASRIIPVEVEPVHLRLVGGSLLCGCRFASISIREQGFLGQYIAKMELRADPQVNQG